MNSFRSPHRNALGHLWAARIAGLASLALLSSFLVGEGLPLSKMTAREAVLFLCFPLGVMLGLVWGWRQPTVGGRITLGALAVFYALYFVTTGRVPSGPWFALFASPALLFLIAGRRVTSRPPAVAT
ncbi:MAG: DUF7670 domain-containing protein [Limisphaerales bacterium]